MTEYAHGTPSWVELSTTDDDASLAFYGELFGWTATEKTEAFGGYRTFLSDGLAVGGLNPMGEQPLWTTYVATDDADATTEKVGAGGGTVIAPPMDVGDLGRMAVFLDPAGAVFGVWQAGEMRGAGKVNAPGSFCWNELHTGDREAAKAFYTAVFGWEAEDEDIGGETYTVFSAGGRPVAGSGGAPETQPHWLTWFAVASTDDAVAKAQELGATLAFGPFDIPTVGRCAGVTDPQGALFGVLQGETADE